MAATAVEKELPPLFKRHVRRPRLTQILDASTAQTILLTGPAGYGKTTLAAEWLQGRDAGFWYRATAASADVAAFSAGVVEVIQPVLPGAGDRVLQRLRVPELPERMARILAEILAEDIDKWPRDKWLVVDDYHLVTESTAVEEFVDWLLTLSPIRLIATSRARPVWASARRMLYGEITEITREQLAMTPEETHEVLKGCVGKHSGTIAEQARGWPALVGLASLAGSTEAPTGNVSETLYRYFAEEILRRSSESRQLVLLQLATLPRLTHEYFALLDTSSELIEDILYEQPLVLLDEDSRHFHPMLREFLIQQLAEGHPDAFADLHARLIAHARDKAHWPEAFELAIRSGDLNAAVSVACEAGPELLTTGRHETLAKWLSDCDEVLSQHPSALLLQAETLLRRGGVTEAYGIASEVCSSEQERSVAARAWRLRGKASYWLGENERGLHEQTEAFALADDRVEKQEALWGAFLTSQQLDHDDASTYLDELEKLVPLDAQAHLRLAVGRSVTGARRGTFRGAHDFMEASAGFLRRTSDPEARSSFLAHWAYVEISRARYEHALELATEAAEYAKVLRLGLPLHSCLACQALAEIGLRRFESAKRIHTEMRRVEIELPDPTLPLQTLIVGIKLKMARGSSLDNIPYTQSTGVPDPSTRDFMALQALVAAARGDTAMAQRLAETAQSSGSSVESTLYSSFAMLITERPLLDETSAQRRLEEAVRSAYDRDCIDAYVLAYRTEPRLLELAAKSLDVREMTVRALALARDRNIAAEAGLQAPVSEPHSILTPRELEVFGLVAQGLSNPDIAEKLVISPSTAKVHVHNLMRKLGARSRMDAILRFGGGDD